MSQARRLAFIEAGTWPLNNPPRYDGDKLDLSMETIFEKSLTVQSEKDACDLNFVMKRYTLTGELPIFQYEKQGQFIDVTHVPTYEEAMNRIAYTESYFSRLNADQRKQFDSNPAKFLDWLADPANRKEAGEQGYLPKLEEEPAAPPAPIPGAPPAAKAPPGSPQE